MCNVASSSSWRKMSHPWCVDISTLQKMCPLLFYLEFYSLWEECVRHLKFSISKIFYNFSIRFVLHYIWESMKLLDILKWGYNYIIYYPRIFKVSTYMVLNMCCKLHCTFKCPMISKSTVPCTVFVILKQVLAMYNHGPATLQFNLS